MVAAWMSGYFRGARNQLVFDFTRFNTNGKLVSAFCKKNGGADERHSEERTLSKRVMLSVACAWPVPDEPPKNQGGSEHRRGMLFHGQSPLADGFA